MTEHIFRLWQEGMVVAKVCAPTYHDGLREISHYAAQYEQDGPVRLDYKSPQKKRPQKLEL